MQRRGEQRLRPRRTSQPRRILRVRGANYPAGVPEEHARHPASPTPDNSPSHSRPYFLQALVLTPKCTEAWARSAPGQRSAPSTV